MKKYKKNQVLFIHWTDAIFDEGWQESEEYKHDDKEMEHYTVGRFVRQNKKSISVCQSWQSHTQTDEGIGEIMTIPAGMVKRILVLKTLKL